MAVRSLMAALVALLAMGCDSPAGQDRLEGLDAHTRVDQQSQPDRAQLLFDGLLRSLGSREHYVIEGHFLRDGAKVALHSHFNGYRWRDGVQVTLRYEKERARLEVLMPGFTVRSEELPENFVGHDGRFKARIEVHNAGPAGARVLVWNFAISYQGDILNPRDFISEANAEFDSRTLGWVFTEHGRGVRWGVEPDGVRLVTAYREAPYAP